MLACMTTNHIAPILALALLPACTAANPDLVPPDALAATPPDAIAVAYDATSTPDRGDGGGGYDGSIDLATTSEPDDGAVIPSDLSVNSDLARLPPATCAEVRAAMPGVPDGAYTLYSNHAKPWVAYCRDMANMPSEYLSLPMTGNGRNFGQYTAGAKSPGTDVRTYYQRVRIDPATFMVNVGDQTFATSTGMLTNSLGPVVTSMPYAVAADCTMQGPPTGVANIDLSGTPFKVMQGVFNLGPKASGYLRGMATYSANDQVVDLIGGGWCGGIEPNDGTNFLLNGAGTFELPLILM